MSVSGNLSDDTRTTILKAHGTEPSEVGPIGIDATEDRRITAVHMHYADDGPSDDDVAGNGQLYLGTKTPQNLNADMAVNDVDFFLEWHFRMSEDSALNVAYQTPLGEFFDFSGSRVFWERNVTLNLEATFYFLTGDDGSVKAEVFYEEV